MHVFVCVCVCVSLGPLLTLEIVLGVIVWERWLSWQWM